MSVPGSQAASAPAPLVFGPFLWLPFLPEELAAARWAEEKVAYSFYHRHGKSFFLSFSYSPKLNDRREVDGKSRIKCGAVWKDAVEKATADPVCGFNRYKYDWKELNNSCLYCVLHCKVVSSHKKQVKYPITEGVQHGMHEPFGLSEHKYPAPMTPREIARKDGVQAKTPQLDFDEIKHVCL